jgi:hypothetical protein
VLVSEATHERRDVEKMMTFSLMRTSRLAGLLVLVLLSPRWLAAQEPPAAQSAPAEPATASASASAIPHLAELIPLATTLSDRFIDLEARLKRGPDPADVKTSLAEAETHLTKYAAELDTFKTTAVAGSG